MFEQVKYRNFSPSYPLVEAADATLDWLQQMFADNVVVNSELKKIDEGYRCKLRILSDKKIIRAISVDNDPMEALDKAIHEIKEKIKASNEPRPN
jgi:ribosome-associated translation inhibitor RaiA